MPLDSSGAPNSNDSPQGEKAMQRLRELKMNIQGWGMQNKCNEEALNRQFYRTQN
jgi:hypothetical protein